VVRGEWGVLIRVETTEADGDANGSEFSVGEKREEEDKEEKLVDCVMVEVGWDCVTVCVVVLVAELLW
jgi:hypothetical protein